MKNYKRGFTLAELLMCVAIIAVVSAMGATITKKTTEKAYNTYFYTGYATLANSIAEIYKSSEPSDIANFAKELNNIINNDNTAPANNTVTATNGISYKFVNKSSTTPAEYIILMKVPQAKTRANTDGMAKVRLIYTPANGGHLIPVSQNGYVDLKNRPDLISFYVDNGTVNRNIPQIGYTKPTYTSYEKAYCQVSNNESYSVERNFLLFKDELPKIQDEPVTPIKFGAIFNYKNHYALISTGNNHTLTEKTIDKEAVTDDLSQDGVTENAATPNTKSGYIGFLGNNISSPRKIIDCDGASKYAGTYANGIIKIAKPR